MAGADRFGAAQADRYHDGLLETFAFLTGFPRAARERHELTPPVRAFRYKAHVIVYELDEADNVVILRVRHGREDWTSDA